MPAQAVAYARITAEGASTSGSTSGEALLLERGAKFRIVRNTKACAEHPVPNSMNLRVGIYRGGGWWTTAGRTWFDNIRYGTP